MRLRSVRYSKVSAISRFVIARSDCILDLQGIHRHCYKCIEGISPPTGPMSGSIRSIPLHPIIPTSAAHQHQITHIAQPRNRMQYDDPAWMTSVGDGRGRLYCMLAAAFVFVMLVHERIQQYQGSAHSVRSSVVRVTDGYRGVAGESARLLFSHPSFSFLRYKWGACNQ